MINRRFANPPFWRPRRESPSAPALGEPKDTAKAAVHLSTKKGPVAVTINYYVYCYKFCR